MIFSNFHEFLHTLYKYVLNLVVKISVMFPRYFDYCAIILGGGGCGHAAVYKRYKLEYILDG